MLLGEERIVVLGEAQRGWEKCMYYPHGCDTRLTVVGRCRGKNQSQHGRKPLRWWSGMKRVPAMSETITNNNKKKLLWK